MPANKINNKTKNILMYINRHTNALQRQIIGIDTHTVQLERLIEAKYNALKKQLNNMRKTNAR